MSDIAALIDNVIRHDLAVRLKKDGYRKNGRTFVRVAESLTWVVNVQSSRWNDTASGTFTVNLGVYFPAIATISNAPPLTSTYPKESDCTVRKRLGALVSGGSDHWWSVDEHTEVELLALSVGEAWARLGRPWIERMSELDVAHEELVKQKMFFVAASISFLQGRREEATELVHRAEKQQPLASHRIRQWAINVGLLANGP